MRAIKYTRRFKRDYRREQSGVLGKKLDKILMEAVNLLVADVPLPQRYVDHPLAGEWADHRDSGLHYSERDSWDRMLQSGVQLLDRFAQDDRIRIRQPRRNLQIKFTKPWPGRTTSLPTWMP